MSRRKQEHELDDEQENDLPSSIVADARKMTSAKFVEAMRNQFVEDTQSKSKGVVLANKAKAASLANAKAEFDDSHWGDLLEAAQEHPNVLTNISTLLEMYEFPIGGALKIFCSQEPSDEEDKDRVFEKIFARLLQFTHDKDVIKKSFVKVARYSFKEKAQQSIRKLKEKLLTEEEWAELESKSKLQAESYLEAADGIEEKQSSESDSEDSSDSFIAPSDDELEAQSVQKAARPSRKRSHVPSSHNSDSDFDPDEHQAEREARKEAKKPKREKARAEK